MVLCVYSKKSTYYTIHIFSHSNENQVEEYKNLLYSLLQTNQMYDVPSLHGFDNRVNGNNNNNGNNNTGRRLQDSSNNPQQILLTGNGFSGYVAMFLLMLPIVLVLSCMSQVFVNTKKVKKPILMGVIDS